MSLLVVVHQASVCQYLTLILCEVLEVEVQWANAVLGYNLCVNFLLA